MLSSSGPARKQLPPYVSYRTFWNFIEGLQQTIPARIDRSYWGDRFSGSNGTQLTAALRFLDLTDPNGFPTTKLRQLVGAKGSQRTEVVHQITHEAYGFLFQEGLDAQTCTHAQLEEAFHENYQVASDVARKCIKFFTSLAGDGGFKLSPFITGKSRISSPGANPRKGGRKTNEKKVRTEIPLTTEIMPNGKGLDKLLIDKFPSFDPAWPDEIKAKWFAAFDQLIRRTGG
jgi:hypothetical protein